MSCEKTNEFDSDNLLWQALQRHIGHNVCVVYYGNSDEPADICLECENCGEVVLDAGLYTVCVREDV